MTLGIFCALIVATVYCRIVFMIGDFKTIGELNEGMYEMLMKKSHSQE